LNDGKVILKKEEWEVPEYIEDIRIFRGGRKLNWQVERS